MRSAKMIVGLGQPWRRPWWDCDKQPRWTSHSSIVSAPHPQGL